MQQQSHLSVVLILVLLNSLHVNRMCLQLRDWEITMSALANVTEQCLKVLGPEESAAIVTADWAAQLQAACKQKALVITCVAGAVVGDLVQHLPADTAREVVDLAALNAWLHSIRDRPCADLRQTAFFMVGYVIPCSAQCSYSIHTLSRMSSPVPCVAFAHTVLYPLLSTLPLRTA